MNKKKANGVIYPLYPLVNKPQIGSEGILDKCVLNLKKNIIKMNF